MPASNTADGKGRTVGPISLSPANLLSAFQLADSFFPSGMYAHSHGLETMISRGRVRNAPDVAEFLENQFSWTVFPSDGVALLESYRAAAVGDLSQIVAIDDLLLSMKVPAELRNASTQLGQRLLTEVGAWDSLQSRLLLEEYTQRVLAGHAPGNAPGNGSVALGVVGQALEMDAAAILMTLCHSYAVSVLGAASRLMPFTHTDAQTILRRLHPLLERLTGEIWERRWSEMRAFSPELDLAAMNHERDDVRLFAS